MRQDGKWLVALLKEWQDEATGQPSLKDVEWLIGTWESMEGDLTARTTYAWTANKAFIRADYTITPKREGKSRARARRSSASIRQWGTFGRGCLPPTAASANRHGVLRGNYYNATTDAATPVSGLLDKETQRVAWTIEGQSDMVYDTGLYNLTLDESTLLVHFDKDRTEQYTLLRVQRPEQDSAATSQ